MGLVGGLRRLGGLGGLGQVGLVRQVGGLRRLGVRAARAIVGQGENFELGTSCKLASAGEKKTTYYDKEGNKGIFNNQGKWENNSCDKK